MPLLNDADDVRVGTAGADKVYLGANLVWEPAAAGYSAEVLADSPVAYWRMEETSGATVADEIGSNDGTVTGANLDVVSWAPTGSAVSFDGVDDRLTVAHNSVLNIDTAFTFEALVQIANPTADKLQVVADKTGIASANGQWALTWDNRSSQSSPLRLRFIAGSSGGNNTADYTGTEARDAVASGIHFVGTVDLSAASTVRIWVNGVNVGTSPEASNSRNANNTRALSIGMRVPNNDFPMGGVVDEVAIYDKVLSAGRILAHAEAAGVA